ncbi:ABC transporter permease [Gordonia sp. NPDC003376]
MTQPTLPREPAETDGAGIEAVRQWWALTMRGLGSIMRNGEVIFAFVSPAFLAVAFYVPLRSIMSQYADIDYAKFLMPIIALQSVGFVASSAAMRSCLDATTGITTRFRTMPVWSAAPILARFSANLVLLVISVVCAAIASLLTGWRPGGGVGGTIGLYTLVLVVGIGVAVLSDAVGLLADSPETTSQAIGLPLLILGMLSTGFMPAILFPDWIAPFARNQPVSQFAKAMRAFDDGTATWSYVAPAVWWCVALIAGGAVLTYLGTRKVQR